MRDSVAVQDWDRDDALFVAIGAFLRDHGLAPDPTHYSFAHAALTEPVLSAAVDRLTDGGVRLNRGAIERLGGTVTVRDGDGTTPPVRREREAARLVAQTQAQVDGFAALMRTIRHEASDFGRGLVETTAAIRRSDIAGIDEIARITGVMLDRLRATEARLARATSETEALRTELAEAQHAARRDPLTGLANRLAFEEAFDGCAAAAGPYCLALCDVDHFKRLNDEHGHAVGDRMLSAIGAGLAAACEGHLVARHGGEEFAVLLTGLPLAAAAAVLDAARADLAAKRFRNRDTDQPLGLVTLSAGVTAIRPDDTTDTAFARADRLLYAAKAEGRDRISAG